MPDPTKLAEAVSGGGGNGLEKRPPTLTDLVQMQARGFERALAGSMDVERFVRIALTAVKRVPRLALSSPDSLLGALMLAAQLGLEPSTPLGECYLVPFKNGGASRAAGRDVYDCTFILGYRGKVKLAFRSGMLLDVQARAVRQGDEFEYAYGLEPVMRHVPRLDNFLAPAICYYVVARFKDGGSHYAVVSPDEIEAHRKRSKTPEDGPWVTDYEAMALKTCVHIAARWWPLTVESQRQMMADDVVAHGMNVDLDNVIDVDMIEQRAAAAGEPVPPMPAAEAEKEPAAKRSRGRAPSKPADGDEPPAAEPPGEQQTMGAAPADVGPVTKDAVITAWQALDEHRQRQVVSEGRSRGLPVLADLEIATEAQLRSLLALVQEIAAELEGGDDDAPVD